MALSSTSGALTPAFVIAQEAHVRSLHGSKASELLSAISRYLGDVLTTANPAIGRAGAVCPFMRAALMNDMISFSISSLRYADPTALEQEALSAASRFPDIEFGLSAKAESLRAVVIVLPYLEADSAATIIETVQKTLKPDMIENGLMIGEFYPGCTAPGLHSSSFRPADTPFAFLAIRRLTPGDLPFLIDDDALVESYLTRFGEDGRRRLDRLRASSSIETPLSVPLGVIAQSGLRHGVGRHAQYDS